MKNLLLAILLLSAVANADVNTTERFGQVSVQSIEHVQNLSGRGPETTVLKILVASHGCTANEDYDVDVKKDADYQYVSFYRTRPDNCNVSVPGGVSLTLATQKLDAHKAVVVRNPVYVNLLIAR